MKTQPRMKYVAILAHAAMVIATVSGLAAPLRLDVVPVVSIGKWPQFPRGPTELMAVAGSYAYVGMGSIGLGVFDISNPTNWIQLGSFRLPGEVVTGVAVAGNYAYVASPGGLWVVDVSDPLHCRRVGAWTNRLGQNGFCWAGVAVAGGYAYVGNRDDYDYSHNGLYVLDVSNPTNCVQVGFWAAQAGFAPRALALQGRYAYFTGDGGLRVIDVINPKNCKQVGAFGSGNYPCHGLAIAGNYAYTRLDWDGFVVIDISHPNHCVGAGGGLFPFDTYSSGLAAAGNYMFVTQRVFDPVRATTRAQLSVYDVSNPANAVLAGSWLALTDRANLGSITLAGRYAYVADAYGGVHVFDIADPPRPVRVGGFDCSGSAQEVAVASNYAYVADYSQGLHVLDVSDAARPALVGGWTNLASHTTAMHVAVAGDYAYVMNMEPGRGLVGSMDVIDISQPTNCTRVAAYTNVSGEVTLAGRYLCAAIPYVGLRVLDVSNPTNCVWMGDYPSGNLQGGTVAGHYAYLAAGPDGLQVIDFSNPTNCVQVGGWVPGPTNFFDWAWDVAVAGNYAYLTGMNQPSSASAPMQVIDVSNPKNCVYVGQVETAPGSYMAGGRVVVAGKYALVASGFDGCQVLDISNPTNCVPVGAYGVGECVVGVTVAGSSIYLADGPFGVEVLLRSLPGVQFTVRVNGTVGQPLTVEAATNLVGAVQWTPLLTTNAASMPFDFVDYDVSMAKYPQKFYRAHQQP